MSSNKNKTAVRKKGGLKAELIKKRNDIVTVHGSSLNSGIQIIEHQRIYYSQL